MSLVEVIIASTIFLLLLTNVYMVTRAGTSASESGVFKMSLDDELNLTYDRISFAIMAADSDDVDGAGGGAFTTEAIEFSSNLGMSDGSVVRGPVEEISWQPTNQEDGRVVWREEPDTPEEREVNWSNSVPHVFKGEIDGNLEDDNDNGVKDEKGLGFTKFSHRVDIYVTVERVNGDGKRVSSQKVNSVTCRN
ncbi:MAG: hypothetical protein AAFP22_18125 [Planctomycetota bacterium]